MQNELYLLRWLDCGWTQHQAADRFGVTIRTIRNWERGTHRAPDHIADYYRIASGQAPQWAPRWRGWRLDADGLHGPDGALYTPHEIMSARWLAAQVGRSPIDRGYQGLRNHSP